MSSVMRILTTLCWLSATAALVLPVVTDTTSGPAELHVVSGLGACVATCAGTLADPFPSLFHARDYLRATDPLRTHPHGVRVVVHGDHALSRPFELDERDARPATSPVTYTAAPGGARVSGGTQIPTSAFKPVTVPSGASGVVSVRLSDYGVNTSVLGRMGNPHPSEMLELFVDAAPQTLARDPNIAPDGTWMWAGYEDVKQYKDMGFTFTDNATVAKWLPALKSPPSLWLHGYFTFDWRDTFVEIVDIAPSADGFIFTRNASTPPAYGFKTGCRFYAVDNLALLDAPSEYFVDPTDTTLYWLPSKPLASISDVRVSVLLNIISQSGANHTSWDGLVISDSRGTGMAVSNAVGCSISNCTVSNTGGGCLTLSGANSTVTDSVVYGCGGVGIDVSGGDRKTLAPGNISVVGNTVTDFSRIVRTYQPAIGFGGVGLYVANNTMSGGPHTAITGGGNNNLFEFNHISHCSYECTDTGAFYVGRSWSQRGNVARHNTFTNIRPSERLAQQSCSQNAFYLDDEMSGWDFYGNTIRNSTTGILLGGGRDNKIHDNIFIDNDKDIAFDNRGMGWQNGYCNKSCPEQPACFLHDLDTYNYQQPPYSTRYPEIVDIYTDYPCVPVNNVIEDNRYCHTHSKAGAQFVDKTPEQINAWMSVLSNNVEDCSQA